MQRSGKRQIVLNPAPACWVQTFAKACAAFLHVTRALRQQHSARPTPPVPCSRARLSASTFHMLVESDVLTGSRGILP